MPGGCYSYPHGAAQSGSCVSLPTGRPFIFGVKMRDLGMYIERDGVPINILYTDCKGEDPTVVWGRWFEDHRNRRVAATELGQVHVSTIFLGLDHSFGDGPPLVYETMIFGGKHDQWQDRYSTREAADQGHQKAVDMVIYSSWWIRFLLGIYGLFRIFRHRDSRSARR